MALCINRYEMSLHKPTDIDYEFGLNVYSENKRACSVLSNPGSGNEPP